MNTFAFQNKKKKNYFEGWYYRITDAENNINIAVIFALTKDKKHPHSFIQFYDGHQKKAYYYTFDINDFYYDDANDTVRIGQNELSVHHLLLHTDDVHIEATNHEVVPLQIYNGHQSAMGYLSNAPLECFQEVLFMTSDVTFTLNNSPHKGTSYMEKTYGTNFPSQWIWLQSNHSKNGSLISFSVGKVPVLFFEVKGFFLILNINGKEQRYGSYNFSKIKIDAVSDTHTTFSIRKGTTTIIITAKTNHPVELVGPRKNGTMDLAVHESLNATATIKVFNHNDIIFEDEYEHVGLELMY
ncbi:hypothetical protein [Candidatus Xianfuyuplasma coldseepsis]|uniref:Tocopherol cyclase n=1 Tax=Candidatus Xianfuyuplasma coldseepsis TaxID=2782163 RepID=A0A7L7KR81_9MOLU|nr:hypothetical protein [Xianfuyuplasma coldseepsis]QMS84308.1 hypothetical protein G4Z02_00650 [Xianfuyuplasma coldseepsis]